MIVLQALLMTGVAEADIRTYPLDARSVYTVTVGVGQPTTCVFPGIIKGLVGANVSMKPEDNPGILLSHAEGTEYFSVRPLKENAAGALNVMFKGQVYPFAFVCGSKPDQAVILLEEAVIGSRRTTIDAAALREFLQRAKQDERLRALYPAVETGVQRTTPGTVTPYPGFTATVLSALKFVAEDVLVLRVRLESTLPTARTYDAAALAARVGREIFPVALTDASGAIPANGSAEIYVVIAETADGGRANLTGQETFNVLVSRP